jgi:DNA damage-binding protein 1
MPDAPSADGPTRDLELARKAFTSEDGELSQLAHDSGAVSKMSSKEDHASGGDLVRSVTFGGLDGIITTFAIVATVAGAGKSSGYVLLFGIANLIADALSMGFGDYLSAKVELEYTVTEKKREEWEFKNYKAGETQEMVEIYMEKGFTKDDAELIIGTMAKNFKNEPFFIDHVCVLKLGLMPPEEGGENAPLKNGIAMFCPFICFESLPLLPYAFTVGMANVPLSALFVASSGLVAVALMALGVTKAKLMKGSMIPSALSTLMNGGAVGATVFFVAWGLESLLDVRTSILLRRGALPIANFGVSCF